MRLKTSVIAWLPQRHLACHQSRAELARSLRGPGFFLFRTRRGLRDW